MHYKKKNHYNFLPLDLFCAFRLRQQHKVKKQTVDTTIPITTPTASGAASCKTGNLFPISKTGVIVVGREEEEEEEEEEEKEEDEEKGERVKGTLVKVVWLREGKIEEEEKAKEEYNCVVLGVGDGMIESESTMAEKESSPDSSSAVSVCA